MSNTCLSISAILSAYFIVSVYLFFPQSTTALHVGGKEEKGGSIPMPMPAKHGTVVTQDQRRILVSTEFGEISTVKVGDGRDGLYDLQSITMEPNSLFIPVHLHSDMVFYVNSGSEVHYRSLRAFLGLLENGMIMNKEKKDKAYNIIEAKHDFEICNGWSPIVSSKQMEALKDFDFGVDDGPHWNPVTVEIAVVLSGMVHVVCPITVDEAECRNSRFRVEEGDVFVVPRVLAASLGRRKKGRNKRRRKLGCKKRRPSRKREEEEEARKREDEEEEEEERRDQEEAPKREEEEEERREKEEAPKREEEEEARREQEEARKREEEEGARRGEEEAREREEEAARREQEEREAKR
ncbi:hypothetical protein L1987_54599 [Smallanthus sonchifolius]|uniref:Uncharacterized protein n=1 Tax=Smallanthus sonchifolius TaxID=185202 RepID=A0ACB9E734_9ASTR|nr:hypothetical protein L1987_54599 [Smallanthus sonchifolius]